MKSRFFTSSLTAFLMGFFILSIEVLGFRVLAPYFGYSTYVFGALVSLILFALALGYFLGGQISARGVRPHVFFSGVLAAGIYLSISGFLSPWILEATQTYDVVAGTLISTFLLWGFPMAAFASVSPYLIGLRVGQEHPARSAGRMSMWGTIGSIAGSLLTTLYFLPEFGTRAVFFGNAAAAMLTCALWLTGRARYSMVAPLIVVLAAWAARPPALPAEVVHAEESPYSRLEVIDLGSQIALRTERRSDSVYSLAPKDGSLPSALLYNLFSVPAHAINAERALVLGFGTGTMARIHGILNPNLRLRGVELDRHVVNIGERFFGLAGAANVDEVVIADARPFLATDKETYDAIEMDVFRETEVPFYLATKEFFELTKVRLRPGGVFAMNVYDPSPEAPVARRIANTLASVYPETYVAPAGYGSYFLVGSIEPVIMPEPDPGSDERLAAFTAYFKTNARRVKFEPEEGLLTDDHAPIEALYGKN